MRRRLYANLALFLSLTTTAAVFGRMWSGSEREHGIRSRLDLAEKSFLEPTVAAKDLSINHRETVGVAEKKDRTLPTERRRANKQASSQPNQQNKGFSFGQLPGQSATLLPNGLFLLAGGETESGESGAIYVRDSR